MSRESDKIANIIAKNIPYHKQIDVVPASGSQQIASSRPNIHKQSPLLQKKEPVITNERFKVKASGLPEDFGTLNTDFIDGFPAINSGNNQEHTWYDDSAIIDNNEYIDTDSLQGHNPLAGFKQRTEEEIAAEMQRETELFEKSINERKDFLKESYYQVSDEEQNDEKKQEELYVNTDELENNFISIGESLLEEGFISIFIDGEFVYSSKDSNYISHTLYDIIENHKIDINRIKVIKSLSLVYGYQAL